MKNIIKLMFLVVLLGSLGSCKKDENRIFFEGGTPPVLTSSTAGPLVLNSGNAANRVMSLTWTNPNYSFTTGVSSQDVSYTLQVDTTGANFKSVALQEMSIAKELGVNYTVQQLNGILTKMNLLESITHNVEMRIKATLTNGAVPLYSNVIKIVITPYLDVAVPIPPTGELYITGDATAAGWTNSPPLAQKMTKVSNTEYKITTTFTPGFFYKFLSNLNNWQPQYGGSNATGGDLGYNMGGGSDPSAIPTPATPGTYTVTVNFKTGKYTVQ